MTAEIPPPGTTATERNQSSANPRFQSTLELASKSATFLVILISVCGFLVTSLSDSTFGFIEVNPFRPRTLAAGSWFLCALAIPILLAATYTGWEHPTWKELVVPLFPYWIACQFFAFLLLRFFHSDPSSQGNITLAFHWTSAAVQLALVIALFFLYYSRRVPPWLSSAASIVLTIWPVYKDVRSLFPNHFIAFPAIALWLFGIGVATALLLKASPWSIRDSRWISAFVLLLTTIGIFGSVYYPHLDSAMGGGSPIPVTVFFSKESPILPNRETQAYLIDESDAGYYLLGKEDKKAAFVPRNFVSLIFFSDDLTKFTLSHEK